MGAYCKPEFLLALLAGSLADYDLPRDNMSMKVWTVLFSSLKKA